MFCAKSIVAGEVQKWQALSEIYDQQQSYFGYVLTSGLYKSSNIQLKYMASLEPLVMIYHPLSNVKLRCC